MTIFGSLYVDLFTFTGLVALSVSINGGMAKPAVVEPESIPALNRPRFAPGLRLPVGI